MPTKINLKKLRKMDSSQLAHHLAKMPKSTKTIRKKEVVCVIDSEVKMVKTLMITKKQARCEHDWDNDTKKCRICKITEEVWEVLANTRAVKVLRRKERR